ncbi:indoleacetamide hydrolase-like [Convolutriloba macropyga]|uniref:indoleacetamide hydrolase-like n=1 Tax=Convolutriloba macropyga TaxID=536237 RepID=UPI003F52567F
MSLKTISDYANVLAKGTELSVILQSVAKSVEQKKELNAVTFFDVSQYSGKSLGDFPKGKLQGIPFLAKDNINTNQFPTTGGTTALFQNVPKTNAPVIEKLLAEGAVLVGKVGMHELAFGITSNNYATGAVRNPYDLTRMPGGSSGGTGSAVAAEMVPFGLGSDTGGSVRVPAALCGVVGFRPSTGRYSSEGVVPISSSRDSVGPLAHSVEDAILVDSVLSEKPVSEVKRREPSSIKLGIEKSILLNDLEPEVKECMDQVLSKLKSAGVQIVEINLDEYFSYDLAFAFPVPFFEIMRELPAYLEKHAPGVKFESLVEQIKSPDVKAVFDTQMSDKKTTEEEYKKALFEDLPKLQEIYAKATADVDGIIFPTCPLRAAKIGEDDVVSLNGNAVATIWTFIRNANLASNIGVPGISLPATLPEGSKLPIGIEIDGKEHRDEELLAVALAIESLI